MKYGIFARPRATFGAVSALLAFTAPMTGYAQDQTAQGLQLEEVVVNARRVEENLQRVPITVTAIAEDTLQNAQVRGVYDIQKTTPGLTICCSVETVNPATIAIRGIRGAISYFADAPVNPAGGGSYFDLANVQVLKGPQGTLFGLSTDGGAIVYTPRMPTEELSGYAEGGFGTFKQRELRGAVNLPLIEDKLLVRIAGESVVADGYVRDLSTNRKLNDTNRWTGRAVIVARPSDDFENKLVVNYYSSSNHPLLYVRYDPRFATNLNPNGNVFKTFGQAAVDDYAAQQALGFFTIQTTGVTYAGRPSGPFNITRQWNIINTSEYSLNDEITLRAIVNYQRVYAFSRTSTQPSALNVAGRAVDMLPNGTVVGPNKPRATQDFSFEPQVKAKLFDGRLDLTVGSFNIWTKQDGVGPINYSAAAFTNTITGSQTLFNVSHTNAVYAQGTYDLGDFVEGLSITAGYRYSWDYTHNTNLSYNSSQTLVQTREQLGKWKAPNYTVQISYQMTPDTMFYINNSKGSSKGNFNGTVGLPQNLAQYDPESLNNIEAGIKTDLEYQGITARTNLAGYYGFYDGIQVLQGNIPYISTVTGQQQFATITRNAAKGRIAGAEAAFQIVPTDWLSINYSVAYQNAHYTKYTLNGVDLTGLPFIFMPRWKYVLGGDVVLPMDESRGKITLSATYTWQAHWDGSVQFPVLPQEGFPAFSNLDVGANWNDVWGAEGLNLTVYGTNLTNNLFGGGRQGGWTTLGSIAVNPAVPQKWGMRIRYNF